MSMPPAANALEPMSKSCLVAPMSKSSTLERLCLNHQQGLLVQINVLSVKKKKTQKIKKTEIIITMKKTGRKRRMALLASAARAHSS